MATLSVVTSNVIRISLLVIIIFALEAESIFPKLTVQIINTLDPPSLLRVHCKSKDDDLGFHVLESGKDYQFTFTPSIIIAKTTLFFCNFAWPQQPSVHYLEVYNEDRDGKCQLCSWKINAQGGCRYDKNTRLYSRCSPWNNHRRSTYMEVGTRNSSKI